MRAALLSDVITPCLLPLPAEAALNSDELRLMRNMMARVDRLAQAAADVSAWGGGWGCPALSTAPTRPR